MFSSPLESSSQALGSQMGDTVPVVTGGSEYRARLEIGGGLALETEARALVLR